MISLQQLSERSELFAALPEDRQRALRDELYLLAHTVVDECCKQHTASKKPRKDKRDA